MLRYEFKYTIVLEDGWSSEGTKWVHASSSEEAEKKFLELVDEGVADWWIEGVWSVTY